MLKISHKGGEKVSKGSYWNFSTGERGNVSSEERLPGDGSVTYYKANPVIILAAGPVLGLLYAAFLPFIGIAIVTKLVVTKIFAGSLNEIERVSTFNWSPVASYLAGRRQKNRKTETPEDKKGPKT